eukprot:240054_1
MPHVVCDYVNSGISINYVRGWALKEALRELIQNGVDAMAEFMNANGGKKSEWKVLMNENDGTYRSFSFIWPAKNDLLLGKITYDPLAKMLIIENPGTINKFNLLLGGSGAIKKEDNPDIIGRFGEGMKLAALALLRPTQKPYKDYLETHNRILTIDTGGDRWSFKLEKDKNFNDEICLFYKISKLSPKKLEKLRNQWTYTKIYGLTLEEWNNSYKNFIFFCKEEEIMSISTISPNS